MARTYDWGFPLPRTHTGILQGNGTLGAMIWGEGNLLCVTLGRADLWDHRGGMPWTERMSYANIRDCLQRGDETGLRELFEKTASREGEPASPSVLPVGRIELDLGAGAELQKGTLNLDDGAVRVRVKSKGSFCTIAIVLDMENPLLCIAIPEKLGKVAVRRVPAWQYVGEHLASVSFRPPDLFASPRLTGWFQSCPADPGLCVGYRREGQHLVVATTRGEDAGVAKARARTLIDRAAQLGFRKAGTAARRWWDAYWKTVPDVTIPNDRLAFLYWYGMYKLAGFTNPAGVPATLQGPWIEEYQMPPWSSDYHFNINVQMCYQPAYQGNRLENLLPLFEMVFSWQETLRHNARVFVGIDDGVMLPHAVDDRCTCMGGFWTGSVDHGCTAWVAVMMHRYYRYSMDKAFLRRAYPFMLGAMRVYEEMLEREGDGFVLPVSVSPEYRGAQMDAWGRNASFQLACVHALCRALVDAAEALGEEIRPVWREIMEKLPKACLAGEEGREMIALWEGVPLEESHRHHSHLAGIAPFDILHADDPDWGGILERSLAHWIAEGPGLWSGWCVPWASTIHSHVGNAEAAELWLEVFDRVFTNEGHGTLHDAHVSGLSLMGVRAVSSTRGRPEIMQMDGGMGAVAAIQEMLLHTRRGVNYLFQGAPKRWTTVGFQGMRTDGAFIVSARREGGRVTTVTVEGPAGGVFRLANPWDGPAAVQRGRRPGESYSGTIVEIETAPGETITIRPAGS